MNIAYDGPFKGPRRVHHTAADPRYRFTLGDNAACQQLFQLGFDSALVSLWVVIRLCVPSDPLNLKFPRVIYF